MRWIVMGAVMLAVLAGCVAEKASVQGPDATASTSTGSEAAMTKPDWKVGDWWEFDVDGVPTRFTVLHAGIDTRNGTAVVLAESHGPYHVDAPSLRVVAILADSFAVPPWWRGALATVGVFQEQCFDTCSEDPYLIEVEDVTQLPVAPTHAAVAFPLAEGATFHTAVATPKVDFCYFPLQQHCDAARVDPSRLVASVTAMEQLAAPAGTFHAARIEMRPAGAARDEVDPIIVHYASQAGQIVRSELPAWAANDTFWHGGRSAVLLQWGHVDLEALEEKEISRLLNELHVRDALRRFPHNLSVSAVNLTIDGAGIVEATATMPPGLTYHHRLTITIHDAPFFTKRDVAARPTEATTQNVTRFVHNPGVYLVDARTDYFGRVASIAQTHAVFAYHEEGRMICGMPPFYPPGPCNAILFPVSSGRATVALDAVAPFEGGRLSISDETGREVGAVDVGPGQGPPELTVEVPAVGRDTRWTATWAPLAPGQSIGYAVDVVPAAPS